MVTFFIRNKPVVRIISLVLIMALCISGLSFLTPPAEAFAITATTVGVVLSFLALCGITFANVDIATKAATAFSEEISLTDSGLWSEIQSITDKVDNGNIDPNDPYDPGNLAISAMTGGAVAKLFNKIKSWFGNEKNDSTFDSTSDTVGQIDGHPVFFNFGNPPRSDQYYLLPYTLPAVNGSKNITITVNGTKFLIRLSRTNGSTSFNFNLNYYDENTSSYKFIKGSNYEHDTNFSCRWGICVRAGYIHVLIWYLKYGTSNIITWKDITTYSSGVEEIAVKEKVPYSNKTKYPINTIYKALSDKIKAGESVKIDISELLTELQDTSTENLTINQEQLLVDTDIKTILEDIAANQPSDPFDGVPKPSPMPTIGNIWDFVSDFLADALIWMKLWVSGFNELPQSLQQTLWAILVVVIVIGILGVIL